MDRGLGGDIHRHCVPIMAHGPEGPKDVGETHGALSSQAGGTKRIGERLLSAIPLTLGVMYRSQFSTATIAHDVTLVFSFQPIFPVTAP